MFHHNNRGKIDETPRKIMIFVKKKNSCHGSMTPPEDRVIALFAGLLTNHDLPHIHYKFVYYNGENEN